MLPALVQSGCPSESLRPKINKTSRMMLSEKATIAGMPAKMVTCLLCEKDFARQALKDHIACSHLNYVPHRCYECGFSCVSSKEMFHHSVKMSHTTVLYEQAKNEYVERIMERFYHDCINASEKMGNVETVREMEAGSPRNDTPTAAVGDGGRASEFDTSTWEMPTPFAISQQVQPSAKAPHHDVPAANPNANEEEKPDPNKCQLCDAIVPDGEKKEHVKKEHMNATLACVVTGCTYDTTADYFQASIRISSHLRRQHGGFKALTNDEKTALRQRQKDKRKEAERIYHECFNETSKEWVKRTALDNDQASSDDDDEDEEGHRFQPKRIKRQE